MIGTRKKTKLAGSKYYEAPVIDSYYPGIAKLPRVAKTQTVRPELTHRNIARWLSRMIPDRDIAESVENSLKAIKALPGPQKQALKLAYIFSRKVPREAREDLFQDITLALLKANTTEEKLAYAIARFDWIDFWKHYKRREHYSLDSVITSADGNASTLGELLVGEVEFERKQCSEINAKSVYNSLPEFMQLIVTKRLYGKALSSSERNKLSRFIAKEGYKLLTDLS